MSMKVNPMVGHSQLIKRVIQILNLLDREFEFSRSLSSIIIWPADIEDSSCLARHCSVFNISRLWHPYSFFRTIGRDSARFTLKKVFVDKLKENNAINTIKERHYTIGGVHARQR